MTLKQANLRLCNLWNPILAPKSTSPENYAGPCFSHATSWEVD